LIAQIELTYDSLPKVKELITDPANYAILKRVFGARCPELDASEYSWRCEVMLDSIDMQTLTDLGLRFEVHKIKGTMAVQALVPPTSPAMPAQATTVYVQVPHIGLLMIREVQLEENCCTDRLQKMLDDGWMILCVCPPNAQRRPDYILGRAKKED